MPPSRSARLEERPAREASMVESPWRQLGAFAPPFGVEGEGGRAISDRTGDGC